VLVLLGGFAVPALAQVPDPAPPAAPSEAPAVGAPEDTNRATDATEATGASTATTKRPAKAGAVINPRATATRKVRLSRKDNNVARSGPGDAFAIVGVFPRKATFIVIAKSGDWYNLRLSDTETGWIHSSLCEEFDDLSDLQFQPNPRLYSRTGTFVLGGYGGAYAFDRKSNSLVLGGRLGYYVFDRVQAEAGVAWTHVRRPAEIVESLFGLSLEAEDFHMLFYQLAVTYELLPGRQMVPYLTTGVGASIMQGDTETSWGVGAATILFYSRRHCVRWEVRDYRFSSGTSTSSVNNNNVEFTLGTSVLF